MLKLYIIAKKAKTILHAHCKEKDIIMMRYNPMMAQNNSQAQFMQPYGNKNYNEPPTNIIWVQGIDSAKNYPIQPNEILLMLDQRDEGFFYIKVCDNIGMSNLRVFNFTEVTEIGEQKNLNDSLQQQTNNIDFSQFVTKDEMAQMIEERLMQNDKTISATKPVTIIKK